MKLGSRDVTRIKQARAQKAETERRMSIVQPRFGDVEDDVSELPQSIPRVPQQDLLNEASSVSHEDYAAEEQYAGYVQQTTVSGRAAAAAAADADADADATVTAAAAATDADADANEQLVRHQRLSLDCAQQAARAATPPPAELSATMPATTTPAAVTPALRGDSLYVPRGWGGGGGEGAMYEAGSGSLAGRGSGKLRWLRVVHRPACTPVHLRTPAARRTARNSGASDQIVSPHSHGGGGSGGGGGGSSSGGGGSGGGGGIGPVWEC